MTRASAGVAAQVTSAVTSRRSPFGPLASAINWRPGSPGSSEADAGVIAKPGELGPGFGVGAAAVTGAAGRPAGVAAEAGTFGELVPPQPASPTNTKRADAPRMLAMRELPGPTDLDPTRRVGCTTNVI